LPHFVDLIGYQISQISGATDHCTTEFGRSLSNVETSKSNCVMTAT
jgi:hypothetical protein